MVTDCYSHLQLIDEKRWYHFDDSQVSPVGEEEIKTSAAYLLFYQRVETWLRTTKLPKSSSSRSGNYPGFCCFSFISAATRKLSFSWFKHYKQWGKRNRIEIWFCRRNAEFYDLKVHKILRMVSATYNDLIIKTGLVLLKLLSYSLTFWEKFCRVIRVGGVVV